MQVYNHYWVTEGVCYREANGRVKPDAIPTAIFPTDPGIRHVIKPGMETGNETKRNETSLQSMITIAVISCNIQ